VLIDGFAKSRIIAKNGLQGQKGPANSFICSTAAGSLIFDGTGANVLTQEHTMLTEPKKHNEFAERIRAALDQIARPEQGQRFILPWRMDVNQDLKGLEECGCGISQDDPLLTPGSRAG